MNTKIALGKAALIAGIAILVSAIAAPFAEFYIYPIIAGPDKAEETFKNIMSHDMLFSIGIMCYFLTFLCDVVIAWALYILLKPVHEHLSLLAAWLRLVYTIISVVALLHLVFIARLINNADQLTFLTSDQLNAQVILSLHAFRSGWLFAFLFFGLHLGLLGFLIIKSTYIPSVLGILLILTGLGWLIGNLKPILYPHVAINTTMIDIAGSFELIFMLWLLMRGGRIKEYQA